MRHTKIVATIGPASQDANTIRQLLIAGVNVARLNFSHGSYTDHQSVFERLRAASRELNHPITILQDLQGPKIRTGKLKEGSVTLVQNQPLTLTTRQVLGDQSLVMVDFPELPSAVSPGMRILLDDGNLELEVMEVSDSEVVTRVILGGLLKERKGVNLPDSDLKIPGFTEKDHRDLEFGLKMGVDAIAVSFVRVANDILMVRNAVQHILPHQFVPIIAKLERPEAIRNLNEIIAVTDGVMVARGDLGVEMSPQVVPIAQKQIITAANHKGKMVITATQMLDSMINNPRPTRAEASDVANAIFDGTDAVMLSGETAAGKYPIQAVEMMNSIACQAETNMSQWGHRFVVDPADYQKDDTYFITRAARELADDRNVSAIAVFTQSGRTALMMSKARPSVPIYAFTSVLPTFHRMSLYWGVNSLFTPHVESIEEMIQIVEKTLLSSSVLQTGQQVVIICGFPIKAIRPTNLALLHTMGE